MDQEVTVVTYVCDDKEDQNEVDMTEQSPWADCIPEELLLQIFQLVISDSDSSVCFLCRAARVCVHWRDVSYNRALWKDVDLSSGWINKNPSGLLYLAQSRLGEHTTSINLSTWFKLTDEHLKVIGSHCPKLKSLNLSSCVALTEKVLWSLRDGFPCLENLNLSQLTPVVSGSRDLGVLLRQKGPRLKRLVLSRNHVEHTLLRNIAEIYTACPLLEYLDLSHLKEPHFSLLMNIDVLQTGCPRLRVLNLEGSAVQCYTEGGNPGFPDLEEYYSPLEWNRSLRHANSMDKILGMLKTSFKLKRLQYDVRKTHVNLQSIPAVNLEHLKLPKSLSNINVLLEIRWHHSLRVLDLNWITGITRQNFDRWLCALFSDESRFTALRELHLCGTRVSWHALRTVTENCRTLHFINCLCCCNIPRFWACEIRGELLSLLYKQVNGKLSPQQETVMKALINCPNSFPGVRRKHHR